jgi:hypothetical protein
MDFGREGVVVLSVGMAVVLRGVTATTTTTDMLDFVLVPARFQSELELGVAERRSVASVGRVESHRRSYMWCVFRVGTNLSHPGMSTPSTEPQTQRQHT